MKKNKPNKEFSEHFGRFVRNKRLQKKWSQSELASRLGNNYQNISRLERGEIAPTLFWCFRLAEAFEQKLTNFLKDFDPTNPSS